MCAPSSTSVRAEGNASPQGRLGPPQPVPPHPSASWHPHLSADSIPTFLSPADALAAGVKCSAPSARSHPCCALAVVRAGKRPWVGHNEWADMPVIKVALGVKDKELVRWVLERMGR